MSDATHTRSARRWGVCVGAAVAAIALSSGAKAASEADWFACSSGGARAVAACTKILNAPGEPVSSREYALVYRGNAHFADKELDAAAADYSAALKEPQPLAHAAYGLGLVYKARQDWPNAIAAFTQAAASTAEDGDSDHFNWESVGTFKQLPLSELGYALYKNGHPEQALDPLQRAATACPSCAIAPRYLSYALSNMHKAPQALAAANHAIELDPRAPGSFFARGVAKAFGGDASGAVADYDEALRLDPGFTQAAEARERALSKGAAAPAPAADADAVAAVAKTPALDEGALRALVSGKTWRGSQGVWQDALELRTDGSLRQSLSDGQVKVESDGAWAVVRGQLCLFTNRRVCMSGHADAAHIVFIREGGAVELAGLRSDLKPFAGDNAAHPIREFPLDERFITAPKPAVKGHKAVLFYIHGFAGKARGHSPALEYFLAHLSRAENMDVIDADYPDALPQGAQMMRYEAANYGAAAYLARRVRELKRQGYDRIYVGGQSWGGWTSFVLSLDAGLPLDGTILIVPACCMRASPGDPDASEVENNTLIFNQLIGQVRYPTVGLFFTDDYGETGDRGENAKRVLAQHGIPYLIINHPPGFSGHGAAWYPAYDAVYGACIDAFLKAPKTLTCTGRSLYTNDLRTVFTAARFKPDWRKATLGLGAVQGRAFTVYPEGETLKVMDAKTTQVTSYGHGAEALASEFKGGDYCWRERPEYLQTASTDEQCLALVRWSKNAVLGLDRKTGSVRQWWVVTP